MDIAMRVFEYLVYLDEVRDANDKITDPAEMIVDRTLILAKDTTQATTIASREIDQAVIDDQEKFDRLVVVVRPF
jgi:hypothetical protein